MLLSALRGQHYHEQELFFAGSGTGENPMLSLLVPPLTWNFRVFSHFFLSVFFFFSFLSVWSDSWPFDSFLLAASAREAPIPQ